MKKILIGVVVCLSLGWLGNLALYTYRYRVVLRDFLEKSDKPFLLVGSSRLYHNIDRTILHDSVHLIAKPNLYGIDLWHILKAIDLHHYRGILVEYQPIHFSGSKNQLIFWDPRELGFALSWCQSANDYVQVLGNTFLWHSLKAQLTGFGLPPASLDWPMSPYPDLQKQAHWALKKSLAHHPKNLPNNHPLMECPNPQFYTQIQQKLPTETPLVLVYPFGHHQSLAICGRPPGIEVWDFTQLPYSPHEFFDDRHLTAIGARRMTMAFNNNLKAWINHQKNKTKPR